MALIGIAITPVLISAGYIRLVGTLARFLWSQRALTMIFKRVVIMKDEQNKAAHESSAQVACEAAGAIRTVISLTRENDCGNNYSKSLEEPLRRSIRTAIYSNLLYAASRACISFATALVFWVGARDVADQKYGTTAFFVSFFVSHRLESTISKATHLLHVVGHVRCNSGG